MKLRRKKRFIVVPYKETNRDYSFTYTQWAVWDLELQRYFDNHRTSTKSEIRAAARSLNRAVRKGMQ